MEINEISGAIIDRSVKIHQALGPGLMESVYHRVLIYELRKYGLDVQAEVPIPLEWDGHMIDAAFRADLIVNSAVIVELKSVERVLPVHKKQVFTYLKLANIRLGLLINFGECLLKDGIHRIANGMQE